MAKKKDLAALTDFVATQVVGFAKLVMKRYKAVRKQATIEATHDISTSLRRLMAADIVLRELYDCKILKPKQSGLKQFRKTLGVLRDAQEIRRKWEAFPYTNDFARAFSQHLAKEEEKAMAAFLKALETFDLSIVEPLTRKTQVKKRLRKEPVLTVKTLQRILLQRVLDLAPEAIAGRDDVALHSMRVRYKHYRYTIELLSPDITHASPKRLKYLKSLQDAMGEAHDYAVLEERLLAFAETCIARGGKICHSAVRHRRRESHTQTRQYVHEELRKIAAAECVSFP